MIMLLAAFGVMVHAQDVFISSKLEKKWETPKELKTPESVYYYPVENILFVSNIDGEPLKKDHNGFISKLSVDGKIVTLKWADGLNAPKGMGIYEGKLYVSDIDEVVEIDIKTGKILNRYEAEGAKFLNDIAVLNDEILISDSNNGAIYSLKDGKVSLWLKSEKLNGINGLYAAEDMLLAGISDRIVSIGSKDKKINDFILNTGSIDGMVKTGNGYIISDWQGHVNLVSQGKEKEKLLDTTPKGMNAADMEYVKDMKLLLIPTFSDNRVMAYTFK